MAHAPQPLEYVAPGGAAPTSPAPKPVSIYGLPGGIEPGDLDGLVAALIADTGSATYAAIDALINP